MWIFLSHRLSVKTPVYDDGPRLEISPYKQISRGDSSNSFFIKMLNHIGTHVDAPNHFDPDGRKISSFTADELSFSKPLLIEVAKKSEELITADDLRPFHPRIAESDILLLKTGFQVYRETDPLTYVKKGPCLSPDAAEYLRNFPLLRALGVDMVSISSPSKRELGRESHRKLLVGRDFLIIEDMDLLNKPADLKRVLVVPLMVEEVDSAPCTVLAEV
ncbi:MAG: cyclase family protein [Candidatus Caldarchaeum sp.]|nr:cyclase family protein [Candidatus Caldarchaeum sp.]